MEKAQKSMDRQQEKQADAFTTDTIGTRLMDSLQDPLDSRAQTASKSEITEAAESQEYSMALHQQDMRLNNTTTNNSKSTLVIVPKTTSLVKSKLNTATHKKSAVVVKQTPFQQRKAEVLDQAAVETEVDSGM